MRVSAARVGGGLLAAVVLAVVVLFIVFDVDDLRRPLAARASAALGREVVIGEPLELRLRWPVSRLVLHDIEVANTPPGEAPHFLSITRLQIELSLRRLLGGDLVLPLLRVDGPVLTLERRADGNNWQFERDAAPTQRRALPELERLHIEEGRIRYTDDDQDIDLDMRLARVEGSADDEARRIALDGRGSMRGERLEFRVEGGSLDALRTSGQPYPLRGHLEAGATRAEVEGVVREPLRGRGWDLRLSLRGDSAADIYPFTGIALLPTPPYQVSGRLRHADETWRFDDFTGRMGESDLAGWLHWDPRPVRPLLSARFTSERLALADLGPLIGAEPSAERDDGRVLPDVALNVDRLAAMDADVEFHGERVVATRVPLQDFALHLKLEDRVLRVGPLRFTSGAGALTVYATVDGTRVPPHLDSRTEVRALPLAPMFAPAAARLDEPNVASGSIDGVATLRGSGRSLRDMLAGADGALRLYSRDGALSQIVIELVGLDIAETTGFLLRGDQPVPIRCMLADFTARDGVLQPRALVMDTEDTLVTGEGRIALDTETLALRLVPEPKDFSPLSLRTPLSIGGTFAEPEFGVEKRGLIARGVAAAALALAFPPAAIAALFEPGTGEDANCRLLLESPPPQGDGAAPSP